MGTDEDGSGPMSPWDRVANRSACETFVFTVIAIHLGLDPEDRHRYPWSEIAEEIVGGAQELWALWRARQFWSLHARAVVEELRECLTACPPDPAPHEIPPLIMRRQLLGLADELRAQADRPATGQHAAGVRAGLHAASSQLATRAHQRGFNASNEDLATTLGLPPIPPHYRRLIWPTLSDPDLDQRKAHRRERIGRLVRKHVPTLDPEIRASIADEIDTLLPPLEDIIRERQRLNPHEHTITELITQIETRLGYRLFDAYPRQLFSRILLVEADKLIPSHTSGATEFTRGYDQALTSAANRLREHAQEILPPFPLSELGRKATEP
ncbi:MAG: hypothetical protein J2P17_20005 [Mycobacterium sp.]|nr:hypothetical protein [Mycobacterium sp.]